VQQAQGDLARLQQNQKDLNFGQGVYSYTEQGRAVRDLRAAQQNSQRAAWRAENAPGRRDRRAARKDLAEWAGRQLDAEQRFHNYVTPEAERLATQVARSRSRLSQLQSQADTERGRYVSAAKLDGENRRSARLYHQSLAVYRDRLDGIAAPTPRPVPKHLLQPAAAPLIEPPAPQISP